MASGAILDLGGMTRTNGVVSLGNGTIQNGTFQGSAYNLTNGTVFGAAGRWPRRSTVLTKAGVGTTVISPMPTPIAAARGWPVAR